MTSKPISLPDPLWRLIHSKVESGEYRDESEYLAKLAEADLHRQRLAAWEQLSDTLEAGLQSPSVGPFTEDMKQDIRERARAKAAVKSRASDPDG